MMNDMYWATRLDVIHFVLILVIVVSSFLLFTIITNEDGSNKEGCGSPSGFLVVFMIFLLSLIGLCFIPTTKDYIKIKNYDNQMENKHEIPR